MKFNDETLGVCVAQHVTRGCGPVTPYAEGDSVGGRCAPVTVLISPPPHTLTVRHDDGREASIPYASLCAYPPINPLYTLILGGTP